MQMRFLEGYKETLVTYAGEHYIFNVPKGSLAEKDIAAIIALQEKCFAEILDKFGINSNLVIKYYIFTLPTECGKQYRLLYPEEYKENDPDESINGYTLYPDTIFATYNDVIKCVGYHEDVHILMDEQYGDITSCYIKEGIAMAFDKEWWNIKNECWAKVIIQKELLNNIETYFDNEKFFQEDDRYTYPVAGAFTSWLINDIGLSEYKKYYASFLDEKCYPSMLYRKEKTDLFLEYIKTFEVDNETEEKIEILMKKIEKSRNLTIGST